MSEKVQAKDHESYATLSIIGFLVPLVGLIVGAIYLTKDGSLDKKLGEHLVAFSVLGAIVLGLAYYLLMPNFYVAL